VRISSENLVDKENSKKKTETGKSFLSLEPEGTRERRVGSDKGTKPGHGTHEVIGGLGEVWIFLGCKNLVHLTLQLGLFSPCCAALGYEPG
jgi:hypothetical protein